jgi:SAM-dependent methyltransferase
MFTSAYDFKAFYNTHAGRVVRRVIGSRIGLCWPDMQGLTVVGCGYAAPYMGLFRETAARRYLVMPAAHGAHHWPAEKPNLVCLSEESELPFETNSVDRVLLVHSLEYSELVRDSLGEIWRILKSNGRLLVVAPNRLGMWARAEWSPFGHGRPFSHGQLCHQLRDCLFVQESAAAALYFPAMPSAFVLKAARIWEETGRRLYPALGGVHIIEASKQLYAPTGRGLTSKVRIRGRGLLAPRPKPAGMNNFTRKARKDHPG